MPAKPPRPPRPAASAPAAPAGAATLLLIRHGPVEDQGRLVGRRDLTIRIDPAAVARLGRRIGPVDRIAASPAMRCRQTAAALWEQDFGAWEGASYAHLPDLGPLSADDLAATAPPGGESFADACARIVPALEALAAGGGRVAVVAHAGTVRAALARALGSPGAALAFRIAPLSLTRIEASPAGWAVGFVNLTAEESTNEAG